MTMNDQWPPPGWSFRPRLASEPGMDYIIVTPVETGHERQPPPCRYRPPLGGSVGWPCAAARWVPPGDVRPATRGRAREGARDAAALSQGGLHDRDRILARAARRPHRVHGAAASERGLIEPVHL